MRNFLSFSCLLALISACQASLEIIQGRLTKRRDQSIHVELIPVVGIATVELGGLQTSRPEYYFDCNTNVNNGSGIRWSRLSAQNRFEAVENPDGTPGMRLSVLEISYPDLGVYVCSDTLSNEAISLNITGSNPAIVAVKETVEVVQNQSVELEVYVSGYPSPSDSHIKWYYPDYSVVWESEGGGVKLKNNRTKLVLSDVRLDQAGRYTCKVEISVIPYLGAEIDVLLRVFAKPTIGPFSADAIKQEIDSVYTVPPKYVGTVMVCMAKGWPTSDVKWHRDGLPLSNDSGIISEYVATTTNVTGSLVLSRLTWTREFKTSDAGSYECVVHQRSSLLRGASQNIELKAETTTETTVTDRSWSLCSISERSVYFPIRIVGMDCQDWMKSRKEFITAQVHQELLGIVRNECSCAVNDKELRLVGLMQCYGSTQMNNAAAVFSGLVHTNSQLKTKLIFCALSWWQQRSPQLRIDGQFQAVDSSCPMEASPTLSEQCIPSKLTTTSDNNIKLIVAIAGGLGSFISVVILLITIICCVGCYCRSRARRSQNSKYYDGDGRIHATNGVLQCEEHIYDRIDFFSRYSYNEPTTVSFKADATPNEPMYSKLNIHQSGNTEKEGDYAQPHWNGGPSRLAEAQTSRSHHVLSPVAKNRYTHMHSGGPTPAEQLVIKCSGAESLYCNIYQQSDIIFPPHDIVPKETDQIYEQISTFDIQKRVKSQSPLETDPQPYSEPVKST